MKYLKVSGELILSILLIIIGILVIYGSIGLGFGDLETPGPGLFPFFCGTVVCFFSLVEVAGRTVRKAAEEDSILNKTEIVRISSVTFVLLSWILFSDYLGYVLMTAICTFAVAKIMGLRGWVIPVLLSMGTAGFCYLLFDYLLYLDLPRGFFG